MRSATFRLFALSILLFFTSIVYAGTIERCLTQINNNQHRLEREEAVKFCFNKYKLAEPKDSCFKAIKIAANLISSIKLANELTSMCFYEGENFKNLNNCRAQTRQFKSSLNHDEGLFYCYQIFQDKMNKNECLTIANSMIFPTKKDYLKNHCGEN